MNFDENKVKDERFASQCLTKLITKNINRMLVDIFRYMGANRRKRIDVELDENVGLVNSDYASIEIDDFFNFRQKTIFKYLLEGYTQREIASLLGKSHKSIVNQINLMRLKVSTI